MAKVKVPEKRLTPQQFEDALVEFAKSPPDLVNEEEFRRRLQDTTITRYERGSQLLDQVKATLQSAAAGDADKQELKLAVKQIDEAIAQMTHGALAFNKGAPSEGIRNILQITRSDVASTSRRGK